MIFLSWGSLSLKPPSLRRSASFNHLVGGNEQLVRHGKVEQPRGLPVDDKFELGRLHDWQVRRLCSSEDAADIGAGLAPRIRKIGSVAHEPAGFGKLALSIGRGNSMAHRWPAMWTRRLAKNPEG